MKSLLFTVLFTIFSFAGSIKVAAAANVTYAMQDLIKSFNKKYPNIKVETNIGSSGKLAALILNKAPFDIFMSANMNYPNAIYKKDLAKLEPKVYALGELAILSVKDINLSKGLNILLDKKIKKIAIANPKTAPYGVAAKEALKNLKLFNRLKSKFIYGQSVGQTLIYTLRAADIGFVAKSALFSKELSYLKRGKNWIDVNSSLYHPIKQGIVLLKRANSEAKKFYEFILSKEAKEIFKKYGYKVNE